MKKGSVNIQLYLILVLITVFFLALVLSIGLILLLNLLFDFSNSVFSISMVMVASFSCAGLLAAFMNSFIFKPIRAISRAMRSVAKGDFKMQLNISSRIREIQEIYESFNIMVNELDATEILQSDFVSNVSHEFKTPINAIEGYATLLQNTQSPNEEQRQYVDKILLNTHRLSGLVGNILLLSKVENQSIAAVRTSFRLDEQIRQSIFLFEQQWAEKEIDFDVDMEEIVFRGSEGMMFHIWNNLISNAIKFNYSGGTIRILLNKVEKEIHFVIENSGEWIPDEKLAHVFDKFYQVDRSHKQEGNGLGLALAKRIVEINGGNISAENIPSGGCRFKVSLPE